MGTVVNTVMKMLEELPETLQERVVEHMREYIEEIRDEEEWNESFQRTQAKLADVARRTGKEISQGLATPFDPDEI